jgi:hypothetical protein
MQILKVYWMQIEEIACADSGKDTPAAPLSCAVLP